jgi:4-oxalocrotonate tautomerase
LVATARLVDQRGERLNPGDIVLAGAATAAEAMTGKRPVLFNRRKTRESWIHNSLLMEEGIRMPIVDITIVEGRPVEARAALMRQITDVVEKTLGAPRQSIRVIIREVPAFHFAVGGEPKGPPPNAGKAQ